MKKKLVVNRPECVRIFGRDYSISYFASPPLEVANLGLCDPINQNISIVHGLTPFEETDTVLHEIIHGLDFVVGLGLTEHQVRHLASGLVGILQDNPELAQWIIKDKNPRVTKESNREPAVRASRSTGSGAQGTDGST